MDTIGTAVGTPLEEAAEHLLLNLENRRDRSPHTVSTYRGALTMFGRFLADRGMPTEIEHIARDHVESWLDDLKARALPRHSTESARHPKDLLCLLSARGLHHPDHSSSRRNTRPAVRRSTRPMTTANEKSSQTTVSALDQTRSRRNP